MRACPACSAEIPGTELACPSCGELLLDDEWRHFCERYDLESEEGRRVLVEELPAERREDLDRVRRAWRGASPDDRTTSIFNPVPRRKEPPRAAVGPRVSWLVALLPAVAGLAAVMVFAGSEAGLGTVLGASLVGAILTARGKSPDLRRLTMLASWLAVSLAAAVSLYL